ncbi:MAG: Fe-S protein assembly co-chaperone HscB [Acidobacteria bacterium]|nr:Fe-S protein assembly co-chaperone HscB [Acidobacteriota bacterium]
MREPTIQTEKAAPACWECKAALDGASAEAHFCPQCGKIQPLPPQTTYFSFFGLPRKLDLEAAELERQFHQLSWQLHPDRFHNASAYERELSLERTAVLNDAFRTLRDPVDRVEYLLGLEGVRKEGEVKQQAPPDLLEEVFELNEHLEELRAAKRSGGEGRELDELRHRLEKTREAFQQKLDAVLAELTAQFPAWDQQGDRAALLRLSEILNRHSYIRNLVRNVTEELET